MELGDGLRLVHIVDDDESFRSAMERRLRKAGYEVATYASAEHLLDRLPSETVLGCILLDVRIPGLSGPKLQERLKKSRFDAAHHIPQWLSRYSNHGADHQGGCGGLSDQAGNFR